ncbi:uncharacterized protein ASPGLDRAFT_64997 [Aspergillus glaucus CBS 516.65]|uniref:F-box domain-containing protein n=1 Tax=Aspergillus glaucus CBS 516.65 TaxID=1160497 RepID=A0A1L9VSB3_ASPGL|nr:hypothetical protein ASPGLDRAFT_64997 [Aspergillus glaucus CBS 516.65]OJJ86796.1 hypothetical protein ASPGLDRAFT_64997 [Aspergillus glaucus CBS 516.65]
MPSLWPSHPGLSCMLEKGFSWNESTSWSRAVDTAKPVTRPAGNIVPPEILLQIFYMLNPRDFDNARRICSQWMRISLDQNLLESMLKKAGWWDAWQRDFQLQRPPASAAEEQSLVWRMSKRFSTECLLSGRKLNVEKPGFLTTGVIDFSKLSPQHPSQSARSAQGPSEAADYSSKDATTSSKFNVSTCGNYLLVTSGCMIHVYRLLAKKTGPLESTSLADVSNRDIALVASIPCPDGVVSATIDTSAPRFVIAALLRDRVGMVCDLVTPENQDAVNESVQNDPIDSQHYYHDVCSPEDPPRSVSICPGRRCVAFGGGTGIELRWIDEVSKQDCRKHFPMTQPSEILHFLPNRADTPEELRLVSSLADPGVSACQCHSETKQPCQLHLAADIHSLTRLDPRDKQNLSLVRATHCHHYRAIPINDGLHILFIEPRTGFLCIGSDSPIGGPSSLTRALVCAPPFDHERPDSVPTPTVFAAGSDLSWGLRVVAAYKDRLVLYSVPLDVFNVIRKEREAQSLGVMGDSDLARDWFLDGERSFKRRGSLVPNQNGDWEFLLSVSYRPTAMMWPLKIYGKEIGKMDNVVELALQSSHGGARVWAFGASGETNIVDVDTFTSPAQRPADVPCKSLSIDADGSIENAQFVNRSEESGLFSPKSPRSEFINDFRGQHSTSAQLHHTLAGLNMDQRAHPHATAQPATQAAGAASRRRPSYAACIVGFNIPELGAREGRWVENEA